MIEIMKKCLKSPAITSVRHNLSKKNTNSPILSSNKDVEE